MSEPEPRFSWQEALDLLESAPARIEAATSGVPADDLLEPLEPGGWSARDVLGHMRACDHTWGGYIDRILDEDHPSFRAESPALDDPPHGRPVGAVRRVARGVHP